ncbi:hypothetical protein COT97_00275 [Candidatus Falkowbacteria bacterium CG10_big_fil_rev_8_21_14_0_10_39_11]|uniref:Nudix hydrolase domain-containing protein n=1 Tax=Candidatus Falkowbacteria bacterium CG10_big_fil_rev_8_21_14_0_10_39_11 TaxID=1974565 RepID=A0A2H0V6J6_9BACT|nr:MAG: hypothetical protein COT97_00275 [Candidatus Falkowbacteria bacterium CG10_big_fil_rev_8_21_14_0_10_39_11]
MHQEWQTMKSNEIHKNPWYRLVQDDVVMPSGQVGKYTYIDRSAGVIIIALTPGKELYIVGQYRYPVRKFSWELPMGALESGDEDILAAAKRELLEEVGVSAGKWTEFGHFDFCNGLCNQEAYIFVAENLNVEEVNNPAYTEFLTMKKVPLVEVEQMISRGEISNAPTLAAFYRYQLFAKNRHTNNLN